MVCWLVGVLTGCWSVDDVVGAVAVAVVVVVAVAVVVVASAGVRAARPLLLSPLLVLVVFGGWLVDW